jgi:hypothetical protein
MKHNIHKGLLTETVDAVEEYIKTHRIIRVMNGKSRQMSLLKQFEDPVIALQDMDWKLPDEVQKTFYAIYNLLEASIGKEQTTFNEPTIYISINQAIDALETSKEMTFEEINKQLIL